MADTKPEEKKTEETADVTTKTEQQKINEAYAAATVKDKQKKFYVDFTTKQLRRKKA